MMRILSVLTSVFSLTVLLSLVSPIVASAQMGPGSAASPLASLVPIVFMVVVMYFLILRPQSKRQKQHQEFLAQLKRGDQVVTSSGILGTVEGLTEMYVTLEIADQVRIKILRSQIGTTMPTATAKAEVKA
jgi:preprotein translocase subunit YajC